MNGLIASNDPDDYTGETLKSMAPVRDSALSQALMNIEEALVGQRDTIEGLELKLNPLILPHEPTDANKTMATDKPMTSEAIGLLHDMLNRIQQNTRRLNKLHDQLEV